MYVSPSETVPDIHNAAADVMADDVLPERVSVLVQFQPVGDGVTEAMSRTRRSRVDRWAKDVGGRQKYVYKTVLPDTVNLRDIPTTQIRELERLPGVVKVERDQLMHAHLTVSTPMIRALQSQISAAGLSADGSGVRVCVIDTGIDSDHVMYGDRVDTAAGRDFANDDNDPEDDNGHGTNVAGIAVGGVGISDERCGVPTTLQGVAPAATLVGIKVLGASGSGFTSDVIAGIDYAADQSASGGRCDVINLSLGGGVFGGACNGESSAIAANNAVANGVVVVASAGNEANANALGSPACASDAIAVGAVFDDDFPNCEHDDSSFSWCANAQCTEILCTDTNITADALICFSNRTDQLDVTAPGCVSTSAGVGSGGTGLVGQCGTSQAAPHVAGLAALLLSVDPTLTPAEVRQIIRDGAIDLGPPGFDIGYGYGRIDAIDALSLLAPCVGDGDCDDGDACTTDTCVAGSCTNVAIACGADDTCVNGVCEALGACCQGSLCDVRATSECASLSGVFLGGGSVCGSGAANNPTTYTATPDVAIPDGGGIGNPVSDTIVVPDSFPIGDIDVSITITHTWVGDVTVSLEHDGTSVTLIDRPGVPDSTFGCDSSNFDGMVLDDDGTGGAIESQCQTNLTSPPNYTPNNALAAFNGMDAAGAWTITVFDSATPDPGTLNAWSLAIDGLGFNPCTSLCADASACDDGLFCNGMETCDPANPSADAFGCVAGVAPVVDDGVACTIDSCDEDTDTVLNVADDAQCPGACDRCDPISGCWHCPFDLDGDADGAIGTGDFGLFTGCFGQVYLPGDANYDTCLLSNFDGEVDSETGAYNVGTGDFGLFSSCFGLTCETCVLCTP